MILDDILSEYIFTCTTYGYFLHFYTVKKVSSKMVGIGYVSGAGAWYHSNFTIYYTIL